MSLLAQFLDASAVANATSLDADELSTVDPFTTTLAEDAQDRILARHA